MDNKADNELYTPVATQHKSGGRPITAGVESASVIKTEGDAMSSEFDASDGSSDRQYILKFAGMTAAYAQSIGSEFLPAEDTLVDWQRNLSLLRQALGPLEMVVDRAASHDAPAEATWQGGVYRTVSAAIVEAVARLGQRENPNDALGQSRDAVRRASAEMNGWVRRLEIRYDDHAPKVQTRSRQLAEDQVKVIREVYFDRFNQSIPTSGPTTDDEILKRQCMESRKLYLVAYFVACIHPQLWDDAQYRRFKERHEVLLSRMHGPTHYRSSVRSRLQTASISLMLNPGLSKRSAAA